MPIVLHPYSPAWPATFAELAARLRTALDDQDAVIHHIGSTSVPGLIAKNIIDMQLSLGDLSACPHEAIVAAGFRLARPTEDHCPPGRTLPADELAKRLYVLGDRVANLHVREYGRFNQQYPLLCRDYLRAHPHAAAAYGEIKRQLAGYFPDDHNAYYAIKDPTFDVMMEGANIWAKTINWQPPPRD